MPGEIEERTKARRLCEGIDLDETTWSQLRSTAAGVGLGPERVTAILG
jgi:LDH2 family malate/lactate/ureidoglycolate dehydrogenase